MMRALIGRLLPKSDHFAARQMMWMAMILTIQVAGGIVQLMLTTRILGLETFGTLALFIAVTSLSFGLLSMPGSDTITTYITRSIVNERLEEATCILRFIFAAILGLALLAYGLLLVFSYPISNLLGIKEDYVSIMLIYGFTGICMAAHKESLSVLRLADRLPWGFSITTAAVLIQFTCLIITWKLGGGLLMVVLSLVAAACVNGFGMLLAATISLRGMGIPGILTSWSIKIPRDIVRFQAVSFCHSKIGTLGGNLDMLLLGAWTSTTQAGLYRAASRITAITRMPFQPIAPALQAEYSRYWYAADGVSLRNTTRRFTILTLILAVSIFGLLILFHQPIIQIMLGDEFTEVALPLLIMIPGSILFAGVSALYKLPAATGRAIPSLVWNSCALTAQFTALFLLVPEYGAIGAAWANTIYFLVWGIVVNSVCRLSASPKLPLIVV